MRADTATTITPTLTTRELVARIVWVADYSIALTRLLERGGELGLPVDDAAARAVIDWLMATLRTLRADVVAREQGETAWA